MTIQSEPWLLRLPEGFTIKDARGFNVAGGTIGRSLPWPLPPTTAGATRTAIGEAEGWFDYPQRAAWENLLTAVSVEGPLAVARPVDAEGGAEWSPLFPAPRDALGLQSGIAWLAPTAPVHHARGCWTDDGIARAADTLWRPQLEDTSKPSPLPSWWAREDALAWLTAPGRRTQAQRKDIADRAFTTVARTDFHLAIEPKQQTARDAALFAIETRETLAWSEAPGAFGVSCEIGVRLGVARPAIGVGAATPAATWRFGGEGRLARAARATVDPWAFPATAFAGWRPSRSIRLLLVTPGAFGQGWVPDGFSAEGTSSDGYVLRGHLALPTGSLDVTLRAAAIDRPVPVSGWDFRQNTPKPSRLLVPAGSVYFLEADRELEAADLPHLWLASLVAPGTPEHRDGYGLVVPGAWPQP